MKKLLFIALTCTLISGCSISEDNSESITLAYIYDPDLFWHLDAVTGMQYKLNENDTRYKCQSTNRTITIDLVLLPAKMTPEAFRQQTMRAINQVDADILLSAASSRTAKAMVGLAEQKKKMLFLLAATQAELFLNKKYTRPMASDNAQQMQSLVKFLNTNFQNSKYAVVINKTDDYARDLNALFTQYARQFNLGEVQTLSYTDIHRDLDAIIRALTTNQIESVFIPGFPDELNLILSSLKQRLPELQIIGADSWPVEIVVGDKKFHNSVTIMQWHPLMSMRNDKIASKSREIERITHKNIGQQIAVGYDVMGMILQAACHSKTLEPVYLASAVRNIRHYQGLLADYYYSSDNRVKKQMAIIVVDESGDTQVTMIQPDNKQALKKSAGADFRNHGGPGQN